MKSNPAPLAIATALSAEPAAWLAGVLMNETVIADDNSDELSIFLDRLSRENPVFVQSDALGLCVLGLCFLAAAASSKRESQLIESHLLSMLADGFSRKSFVDVVCNMYSVTNYDSSSMYYNVQLSNERDDIDDAPFEIDLPTSRKICRTWLDDNFIGQELNYNGVSVFRRR